MHGKRVVESFNAAIEGFIYALKTERNMRLHFLAAVLILLVAIYLNFTRLEIIIISLTATLVLFAELINTTIEHIVDIVQPEYHPTAKLVKDVAASGVLVTSINAVIVGYILLARRIPFNVEEGVLRVRQSSWNITFFALILVFSLAILGKVVFHKGRPLRGGMPSGHAAIAFAIWTTVTFFTNNSVVVLLTFFMAFLIARHRVRDSIHTVWEVLAGSLLGILVTTLIFQIFS